MADRLVVDASVVAKWFLKSYYDMSYLSLAVKLGCKCCVADQRVLGGVGPTFPHQHVVTLAQLRTP
jgi:predicted nucleic acid-binding protein